MRRYKYLEQLTIDRIERLTDNSMSVDDFVNRAIDLMLGTDCNHMNIKLAMNLPLDEHDYLDMDQALDRLKAINRGEGKEHIFRICEECMRVERSRKISPSK